MGEDPDLGSSRARLSLRATPDMTRAMLMPVRDLRPFQEAINRLVEGENRAAAGGND